MKIYIYIILILLGITFNSCSKTVSSAKSVPPVHSIGFLVNGGVKTHAYTTLARKDELTDLNSTLRNMVTYVLFPNDRPEGGTKERYKKVLNKLHGLNDRMDLNGTYNTKRLEKTNRFIITVRDHTEKVTLENYNYKLSREILEYFKARYGYSLFKSDGPYFITTRDEIFDDSVKLNIFYLNLDKFDESTIAETMAIYKNRLEDDTKKLELSIFDNLKMAILDILSDTTENVIKVAMIIYSPSKIKSKRKGS